jgi:hypothetical protein
LDAGVVKSYAFAMLTVIETPLFQRQWPLYWTEEERGAFCAYIAQRPAVGVSFRNRAACAKFADGGQGRARPVASVSSTTVELPPLKSSS